MMPVLFPWLGRAGKMHRNRVNNIIEIGTLPEHRKQVPDWRKLSESTTGIEVQSALVNQQASVEVVLPRLDDPPVEVEITPFRPVNQKQAGVGVDVAFSPSEFVLVVLYPWIGRCGIA